MSVEIRVPQLPESVADALLVAWRKKPGETVNRDDNLADLETDKVVLEVPATVSGVLKEVKVSEGATVKSGDLLAILEAGAAAAPSASAGTPVAAPVQGASITKLGPAATRVASEAGLSQADIAAAARDGRASKSDLMAVKPAGGSAPAPVAATATAGAPSPGAGAPAPATARAPAAPAPAARTGRVDQRVPMTRLRQRVAERLVNAQHTQALLTTFNEVDLTAVNELRARYKEGFEKKHGVKLGFSSFFVKAAIEGLKRFPVINASVDGTDIIYHEYFDIGVAVSTDRGLMVPVIRDADLLDFAGIEAAVANYAAKARAGSIGLEDLTGGTFSITNGGVFGSLLSTPIVNAPQSAILGMHKTQDRPMAVKGEVKIRPMMYLAVSYDHRIIDGKEAVQFLVTIKDCLEDPGRLLLGV
ncbi:MAG TPA: 2-oxoglutarate dehydrogenase complex dihydrolipoyllysine-residue succinyltransferase [Steroidobacteraceae bacterium]|nr:2-oxoglutarate dehydrogenase complex dihydrolipoyllysine-residue succinyltransferase [Steroidobacteraceae bacterium]